MKKEEAKAKIRDAWRRLRGGELTPMRAALSVAVGVAVGVTPLYGFHWMIVLAICLPLRLDAGVGYLASNVSLPFIAPFLLASELAIGTRLIEGYWPQITPQMVHTIELKTVIGALALGSAVVSVIGATALGALTYGVTALVRRRRAR